MKTQEAFKLKSPYPMPTIDKAPVIRLKPSYYQIVATLRARTGLPLGTIVEQCIDYAIAHMEDPIK